MNVKPFSCSSFCNYVPVAVASAESWQHKPSPHDSPATVRNLGLRLVHFLAMPRCVRRFLASLALEILWLDAPPPLTKHRKLRINQSLDTLDNLGLPRL